MKNSMGKLWSKLKAAIDEQREADERQSRFPSLMSRTRMFLDKSAINCNNKKREGVRALALDGDVGYKTDYITIRDGEVEVQLLHKAPHFSGMGLLLQQEVPARLKGMPATPSQAATPRPIARDLSQGHIEQWAFFLATSWRIANGRILFSWLLLSASHSASIFIDTTLVPSLPVYSKSKIFAAVVSHFQTETLPGIGTS